MGGELSLLGGPSYVVGSYKVTKVHQIAEGGFSFVDLVRDEATGVQYALKRILCQSPEQLQAAQAEIALHQAVSHPFVLALVDSVIQPAKQPVGAHEALLLFPVYRHGSIVDVVNRYHSGAAKAASAIASSPRAAAAATAAQAWPFPEHEVLRLFYAIAQGLQAIHAAGFAHRDVKPQNILLAGGAGSYVAVPSPNPDAPLAAFSVAASASAPIEGLASEPIPVLIDLGSAQSIPLTPADRREANAIQDRSAEHCTASYRPPELWDVRPGVVLDDRADVFSLALTAYFMAFGQSAFENETEGVLTLAIRSGRVEFPPGAVEGEGGGGGGGEEGAHPNGASSSIPSPLLLHPSRIFSAPFAQFIRDLLHPDPSVRPSLRDAMRRSVGLMVAALERSKAQVQTQVAAGASWAATSTATGAAVPAASNATEAASLAATGDEGEFGEFESAASPASAAAPSAADSLSPAALASLIADMQAGSTSSSLGNSNGGGGGGGGGGVNGGFLKFGRKGNPHPTRLQLNAACDEITWTSRGGLLASPSSSSVVNRIPLSRIFAIVTDQVTSKFARVRNDPHSPYAKRAHLCFSLLLTPADGVSSTSAEAGERDPASGEETLDLLADSHQLYRTWTTGLQALLQRQQQQQQAQQQEQQQPETVGPQSPAASSSGQTQAAS